MSSTVRKIQTETPQSQTSEQMEEKINQLVQEIRLLEAYYQEITSRQQAMSAGMLEVRAALEALDGLSKSGKTELLVPLGAGTLLRVTTEPVEKLIVSLGAGAAMEKDVPSAKVFLTARRQELERAVATLEGQRKEIGSRLESQKASLQRMAQ